LQDTEAAQKKGCAFGEEDGHFFDCIQGWMRVMVVNQTLWATHFAEGFGTRDGVFLVALLELLARQKVVLSCASAKKRRCPPRAQARFSCLKTKPRCRTWTMVPPLMYPHLHTPTYEPPRCRTWTMVPHLRAHTCIPPLMYPLGAGRGLWYPTYVPTLVYPHLCTP